MISRIFNLMVVKSINFNIHQATLFKFATFTQKMQKRQSQKSEQQIKKQIQHLANKPTFTLMDYKQRILDELNKLKSSLRAKMSSQTQQQEKQLEIERKVMSSLYEEQLNQQYLLRHGQKKAISLVSQVDYAKVCDIFRKVQRYKKMHTLLRSIKQDGDPLPQSMQELNYLYIKSGLEFKGPKAKYMKYQKRSRIQRGHYIKWRKGQ